MLNGKSVDEIIKSCDKDGNGVIDYNEFKASILGWYIYHQSCYKCKIKTGSYFMANVSMLFSKATLIIKKSKHTIK